MPRNNASSPMSHRFIQTPNNRDQETMEMREDEEEKETTPSCFPLLSYTCSKQQPTAEANLSNLHVTWRESERSTATQISRQLKCKWALDSLIEAHLSKLRAHYTRSMVPSRPADVPRLLAPTWDPPFVTASLSWLGGMWRPSLILSLVGLTLISNPLPAKSRRQLNETIRRLRIQEAVLDEEMAEYQSISVLNLMRDRGSTAKGRRAKKLGSRVEGVCNEMKKVRGVIERAQRMRYKAVEVVVKGGILTESQAAEFLVALAEIQELVRRQGAKWRAKAGVVSIEVQAFDVGACS